MLLANTLFKIIFILSISICVFAANPRRVNCRKYVFAPICRGIAAKRLVSDFDEMLGDDPSVYAKDIVPPQETENRPKLEDIQGQWYINDHRRHPVDFSEFAKKNRKANPDYDAMLNMN